MALEVPTIWKLQSCYDTQQEEDEDPRVSGHPNAEDRNTTNRAVGHRGLTISMRTVLERLHSRNPCEGGLLQLNSIDACSYSLRGKLIWSGALRIQLISTALRPNSRMPTYPLLGIKAIHIPGSSEITRLVERLDRALGSLDGRGL